MSPLLLALSKLLPEAWRVKVLFRLGVSVVPMMRYVRASLVELTDEKVVIRIDRTSRTKNAYNSLFIGAFSVGADCAAGLFPMKFMFETGHRTPPIVRAASAEYFKRVNTGADSRLPHVVSHHTLKGRRNRMNLRHAIVAGAIVGALQFFGQATAQVTPLANWAAAYDAATRTRFIPLELILGAPWNGSRESVLPAGRFVESLGHGAATWTGPKAWRHRDTGESLLVYERLRPGVAQKMAVRKEGDAIGRVEDSRNNSTCDQEAKFPLGLWAQGETRSYEYACWFGPDNDRRRIVFVATIALEEIDFTHGDAAHSLRVRWVLTRKRDGREMDRKLYVFSPGLSLVSAQ